MNKMLLPIVLLAALVLGAGLGLTANGFAKEEPRTGFFLGQSARNDLAEIRLGEAPTALELTKQRLAALFLGLAARRSR